MVVFIDASHAVADVMLPMFYATSFQNGGLDLAPKMIGSVLGTWGLLNGIFQVRTSSVLSECMLSVNPILY